MRARARTDYLVVHCSATPATLDIGAAEIRGWHVQKGWETIGYHFVIRRNGKVETGRPENMIGSHVKNHNANSLGICLVGGTDARQRPENNYTAEQWASLQTLLMRLTQKYPGARILGHRDFRGVSKACPCFDAIEWAEGLQLPAARRMRPAMASLAGIEARPEIEDGDEADPEEGSGSEIPNSSAPPASARQWATAWGGFNAAGLGFGLLSGMDWMGILAFMGSLTLIGTLIFVAMGRENQQKLWARIFG